MSAFARPRGIGQWVGLGCLGLLVVNMLFGAVLLVAGQILHGCDRIGADAGSVLAETQHFYVTADMTRMMRMGQAALARGTGPVMASDMPLVAKLEPVSTDGGNQSGVKAYTASSLVPEGIPYAPVTARQLAQLVLENPDCAVLVIDVAGGRPAVLARAEIERLLPGLPQVEPEPLKIMTNSRP